MHQGIPGRGCAVISTPGVATQLGRHFELLISHLNLKRFECEIGTRLGTSKERK